MADPSGRMLRLLSLLQTHRYWPGGELAERLGVSARTLRRDVDRLRGLGYPVQAQRGHEGGYQLAPGAVLPPLVVDDEEAVALAVGLQTAAALPVEGIAEASVRALAKLVPVMPGRLRRRTEALTAMTVPAAWGTAGTPADAGVLTTAALACRDSERLRFCYTAASGAASSRHAEPYRLVLLARRWYLVCYDLGRQDWRSFRADRIDALEGTGARFRPRELPAADAATFVRAGIASAASAGYDVDADVDAPAALVRERIGRWSVVQEAGHGRCRVRISTDSLEWAAMALGVTGAPFRVRAPAELAGLLADWGRRFTDAAATGQPAAN